MAVHKLVLFYRYTPIADPAAVRLWQRELCRRLGITGRIIISPQGINGNVGGQVSAIKQYVRISREYGPFADIDFSWTDGSGSEFPRLSVKVRDEVVTFGAAGEVKVDESGVVGGGRRLTPQQLHELVEARGDEVALFDGRNRFEAEIGRFRGAIVPGVDQTTDFIAALDSGAYDELKSRPVVTYCTGGIRCEVLSSLMLNRGFSEVYQLDGGIVGYGETFADRGLWEGSLYVFDDRTQIRFSADALTVGRCETCDSPTDTYRDCLADRCGGRALLCRACGSRPRCALHR